MIGKLSGHHAFWNYPLQPRLNATITELIYIPNEVPDGIYMIKYKYRHLLAMQLVKTILFTIEQEHK